MWRWLLVKLPKRFGVLGSLWLISGAMHAIIFIGAFLLSGIGDSRQALTVSGGRRLTDARIVLLPMLKTVRNTQFDQPVRGTKFGVPATKKPTIAQAKKPVKQTPKKLPAKVPDKKGNKTTLANLEKEKKQLELKKKATPKQKVPEKKVEEKKPIVAKTAPKEEPKPLVEEKKETVAQAPEEKELLGDPNATQDVIYVGRDDLREMQTQHVVADALQKHWQAPSGIAPDTLCQIAFDVDKEGRACNITMKQNSKVLIFDVAARTAIVHAHFSPAAQGRQFTVAFKP